LVAVAPALRYRLLPPKSESQFADCSTAAASLVSATLAGA
jgi:hypothetical protein